MSSGLSALVDTEARLDRVLADARTEADALRSAARQRAEAAAGMLDAEIQNERARAAKAIDDATSRELRAIADDARVQIAKYDAIEGPRLTALAHAIARRLVEDVLAEGQP